LRYPLVQAQSSRFGVRRLCELLGVSARGYYAWLKRPLSQRVRDDRRLKLKIRSIYQGTDQRYGSPRVYRQLQAEGERVGEKRVARLMQEERLRARGKRRFRATTDSNHSHPTWPHRLQRQFQVDRVDQVWLGDITYLWTGEGWLYLAVILDLFSRRVVGWSLGQRIDQALTLRALRSALQQRRPSPGLLHHTDQGSQYAAKAYREELEKNRLEGSMSRRGNCWDNAPMESFFATLKRELGDEFESRQEARRLVFEYLEVFYNRKRRHSSLGYLSPQEFERQQQSLVA
jgi:putative transposase